MTLNLYLFDKILFNINKGKRMNISYERIKEQFSFNSFGIYIIYKNEKIYENIIYIVKLVKLILTVTKKSKNYLKDFQTPEIIKLQMNILKIYLMKI